MRDSPRRTTQSVNPGLSSALCVCCNVAFSVKDFRPQLTFFPSCFGRTSDSEPWVRVQESFGIDSAEASPMVHPGARRGNL